MTRIYFLIYESNDIIVYVIISVASICIVFLKKYPLGSDDSYDGGEWKTKCDTKS